jgi:hypothetical protein
MNNLIKQILTLDFSREKIFLNLITIMCYLNRYRIDWLFYLQWLDVFLFGIWWKKVMNENKLFYVLVLFL